MKDKFVVLVGDSMASIVEIKILDSLPKGWKWLDGATTAPLGYRWAWNGKSRFGGEFEHALVKWDVCGEGEFYTDFEPIGERDFNGGFPQNA